MRLAVAISSTQVMVWSGQARAMEEVANPGWEREGWFGEA